MELVARLGDTSDHGGTIISVTTQHTNAEGQLVAKVYDLHSCPIPGHGVTPILIGSSQVICEGQPTAVNNSRCGCGALIIAGSKHTYAPLDGLIGGSVLDGIAVLGDVEVGQIPFVIEGGGAS
jgi:uncharacterized Zn-binding protein involved in type VI secretion